MAEAQGNYTITEVGVIVNTALRYTYLTRSKQYKAMKESFQGAGKQVNEDWGFHGTSRAAITGISKTNFRSSLH